MDFKDYFLKLETGQKLKILPYSVTDVFKSGVKYWSSDLRQYFNSNRDFKFSSNYHFRRALKHYMLCEYEGRIRVIYFGKQIYDVITSYLILNVYPYSTMNSFLEFSIYLHVDVTMRVGGIPSYESSNMSHDEDTDFSLNYYYSEEYEFIRDSIDFVNNNNKLSKKPDIIKNLYDNGEIKDNDPLMRLLKFKNLK